MEEKATISASDEQKETKTRILLVDDHPLMRQALRTELEKQPDFLIIAEASDGQEAINLATTLNPDVVIMDISMPNINGLEATRQIKETRPMIAVLVLTIYTDSEHILSILKAGAGGYLTKSANGDEVVRAVHAIVTGETVLSPSISREVLRYACENINRPSGIETSEKLTNRELEVLKLAAKGISNKDIALRLELSVRTVKSYLTEVFLKLGAASRTEAVIISLKNGILTLEDIG